MEEMINVWVRLKHLSRKLPKFNTTNTFYQFLIFQLEGMEEESIHNLDLIISLT